VTRVCWQQHLAALAAREEGGEGAMARQEANFHRNFDRMAIDFLLSSGQTARARRLAALSSVPLPLAFPKFEAASAAISRLLDGDMGPVMRLWHKNRKSLGEVPDGDAAVELLAHTHLHQMAEVLHSRQLFSKALYIET